MATSIAKLAIQFVADTNGMIAGTQKASNALGGFAAKAKGIGSMLAGALGFVGAAAALHQFVGAIRQSMKDIDALGDSSKKLGISVENLQLLDFAAQQSGVSTEQLNKAFVRMNDTIGEAALGSKGAVLALDRLGLSAAMLKDKNPKDAFIDIADALSKVPNKALQTKMAMDIFGKGAADLLPLLAEGRAGIEALFAERGEMGLLSAEDVKRVQEMDDAWNKMVAAVKMISGEIAVVLAPAFEAFANKVAEVAPQIAKIAEGLSGEKGKGAGIQQAAGEWGANFLPSAMEAVGLRFTGANRPDVHPMMPEQIAEAGRLQMESWAHDDAMRQAEQERKQSGNFTKEEIDSASQTLNRLFGNISATVGAGAQMIDAADKKAANALRPLLGDDGVFAEEGLSSVLKEGMRGLVTNGVDAFKSAFDTPAAEQVQNLAVEPVIGQAAALQRGTAEAFSQARSNAADQQKANEMKIQEEQKKLLAQIAKNTGIKADELKTAVFN